MADKTVILTKAREITGNKASVAVGETMIPDAAILALLDPIVRDLARAAGAGSLSAKEILFSAVALQQDYEIATAVASDVAAIQQVYRSAAHVPDLLSDSDEVEPITGMPTLRYGGNIQMGWQGDVMDVIVGIRRKQRNDRFSWEVVSKADGDYLRLYPMPVYPEVVAVEYVIDGASIDGVSDQFESALVYGACAAILDAQINRIMSDRSITNTWGEAQGSRLKLLQAQRDRYESMYQSERDSLGV